MKPGDIMRTPFEPWGRVKILAINTGLLYGRQTCRVEFIEDHPHGYPQGHIGHYLMDDLKPLEAETPHDDVPF